MLTLPEMAARLGVSTDTVKGWRDRGLLRAERANDKGECLYHPPDDALPAKWKRKPPRGQTLPASGQGGAL